MGFNNFGYQPQYYYPQPKQPTTARIWVQGEAGAKSYLVAPNTTVDLWDSEQMVIYSKSADASGVPSMRIIDYSYRDVPVAQNYVTHDELQKFKEYIEGKLGGSENEQHTADIHNV